MKTIMNAFDFCYSSYFNIGIVMLIGFGFSFLAKASSAPDSRYSPEFYVSVVATEIKFICLLIAISSLVFKLKDDTIDANNRFRNSVRVSTVGKFGGHDNINNMNKTFNSIGGLDLSNPYVTADAMKKMTVSLSQKETVALSEFY